VVKYKLSFSINIPRLLIITSIMMKLSLFIPFRYIKPITVAAPSEAWNVFAHANTGIMGSNPTQGMDVCVYSVFVLGTGLAMG
jgi:hypothetical protein